jgi:hypothetical protein
MAASPSSWIAKAEKSLISDKKYTVDRKTEIYQRVKDEKTGKISMKLIKKTSTQLIYTPGVGLRLSPPNTNLEKLGESGFTLDIAHMLKKMKGKAKWILEDENILINNYESVILNSSGEKWLVRLWIRKNDGAILRYDQYIDNQLIGTSTIEYHQIQNGKYFPKKTKTNFKRTGHIFIQNYENYLVQ